MSLSHARHNREACLYLEKSNLYNDWVITTAYYSALHYAHSQLFPNSYENPINGKVKNYSNFDSFYRDRNRKSDSKHGVLLSMVEEYMNEDGVPDAFRTLKELCWTARYQSYTYPKEIASECVKCLNVIAEYCDPDFNY